MLNLLKVLYTILSESGKEWTMIIFVREYVRQHIPEAKVMMDGWGNLYITKGDCAKGFPTLVCHLDQVQNMHSDDFEVQQDGDMLYGWSERNQRREGLGADDKNGVWICLRCLEECPQLKVFMAVGEEKGCIGSNRADMSFFEDSLYVLEPDCKGGKEIHVNLRGFPCASDDFINALKPEENGFVVTEGKSSDILALTLNGIGVSCANIPAGYYLPHKDDEYTLVSELIHSYSYIKGIVMNIDKKFPHSYKTETQIKVELFLKNNL